MSSLSVTAVGCDLDPETSATITGYRPQNAPPEWDQICGQVRMLVAASADRSPNQVRRLLTATTRLAVWCHRSGLPGDPEMWLRHETIDAFVRCTDPARARRRPTAADCGTCAPRRPGWNAANRRRRRRRPPRRSARHTRRPSAGTCRDLRRHTTRRPEQATTRPITAKPATPSQRPAHRRLRHAQRPDPGPPPAA
jgi:hypothetical protein